MRQRVSKEMEDATRQKQTFLRKNIIETGYDPLPFTEYLSQQRENGHDIETTRNLGRPAKELQSFYMN